MVKWTVPKWRDERWRKEHGQREKRKRQVEVVQEKGQKEVRRRKKEKNLVFFRVMPAEFLTSVIPLKETCVTVTVGHCSILSVFLCALVLLLCSWNHSSGLSYYFYP